MGTTDAVDSKTLLGLGYLPVELPSPFMSGDFARIGSALPSDGRRTSCSRFNLSRAGGLRRTLSVPNPISQLAVARQISAGWDELKPLYERSPISLSRPREDRHRRRALVTKTAFKSWAAARTRRMHRARFTLESDISQFYGSIYTHAIPWAQVGKATEKARTRPHGPKVLGNWIDDAVRQGQEGQTRGIPIGPDTSLAIAELILCDVDAKLAAKFPGLAETATRYMDDLHVFTSSRLPTLRQRTYFLPGSQRSPPTSCC